MVVVKVMVRIHEYSLTLAIQKQERDHWYASWELETMLAKQLLFSLEKINE